jgi:hypothetical protein
LPRTAWYQDAAALWPNPVVPFSYYNWLSDPVRTLARTVWFQPTVLAQPASDVTGLQYPPLSEPVRTKPGLLAAQQQFYTSAVTVPQVFDIRWYSPLSDPVRTLARTAFFQAAASLTEFPPFPEEVSEDRWHQPWSEPVRTLARAPWYQALAFAPNPVVSFSYYSWLSEPQRSAARTAWFQPTVLGQPASDVTGIKFTPLSEPVRQAPALATPSQQAFFAAPFTPIPMADLRWFAPLSEPVRLPSRTVWFDPSTRSLNPVVSFSYYQPLTEPVRTAARTLAGAQPYLAFFPTPVVPFSYYNWLSEPVRQLPALQRGLELFNALPRPFIPLEPAGFRGWYAPWREPVRVLPRTVFFDPTTMPPRVISAFTSGTMAAIELGDQFLAGAVQFNRVFGGEVGIIVRPTTSAQTSLIVPLPISARVATVAAQPVAPSGAPITPTSSAQVGIREIKAAGPSPPTPGPTAPSGGGFILGNTGLGEKEMP